MTFDSQRVAVIVGDGIDPGATVVARYPGLVCVARSPNQDSLRHLLDLCSGAAGTDPGRALARRLAAWLAGPDAPGEDLAFGTVAAAGDRVAVFLTGAVGVVVPEAGVSLSGNQAAAWTDRLLDRPDSPIVLTLDGAAAPPASDVELLDLRVGVVPGLGVVLVPRVGAPVPSGPTGGHVAAGQAAAGRDADEVDQAHGVDRLAVSGSTPVGAAPDLAAVAVGQPRDSGAGPDDGGQGGEPDAEIRPPAAVAAWIEAAEAPSPEAPGATGRYVLGEDEDDLPDDELSDELLAGAAAGAEVEPGGSAAHPLRNGASADDAVPAKAVSADVALAKVPPAVPALSKAPPSKAPPAKVPAVVDRVARDQPAEVSADDEPTVGPRSGSGPAILVETERAIPVVHPARLGNGDPPLDVTPTTPFRGGSGGSRLDPTQARGIRCHQGHLSDPRSPVCIVCGIPIGDPPGSVVVGVRPELGLLVFDDGATYSVDGEYLVGRLPESDIRVRSRTLRPIVVEDRSGAVSRAHAEVRISGWDVLIKDSGSRNGTFVAAPGESGWTQVPSNHQQLLLPGTRVRIGGRTFVFEGTSGAT